MSKFNVKLVLFSALAVLCLCLGWGTHLIPKIQRDYERQQRHALNQEQQLLESLTKARVAALKHQLLDAIKSEVADGARPLEGTPYVKVALIENAASGLQVLSQREKIASDNSTFLNWVRNWNLSTIPADEVHFFRFSDAETVSQYALVVPVRKGRNGPLLFAVGVLPTVEFAGPAGLHLEHQLTVFSADGYALALSDSIYGPASYAGSSVKSEPVVEDILNSGDVSASVEWTPSKGSPRAAVARRVAGTNLFVAVSGDLRLGGLWWLPSLLYLMITGLAAIVFNWLLLSALTKPLFAQVAASDEMHADLLRQLRSMNPTEKSVQETTNEKAVEPVPMPSSLPSLEFVESPKGILLSQVIDASLRSQKQSLIELGVQYQVNGLEGLRVEADPLQLQTAVEEVLKNSMEAMALVDQRRLMIDAQKIENQVVLTIGDSGCGIAPHQVAHVFDPFFSTKDSQGVARGLGLNVVRRVVEELKGRVEIASEVEGEFRGTRVKLKLLSPEAAEKNKVESWPQVEIRKPMVRAEL